MGKLTPIHYNQFQRFFSRATQCFSFYLIFTGATTIAIIIVTVGCQTIHTAITVASTATITETGVETANRHHGITIQATAKVRIK